MQDDVKAVEQRQPLLSYACMASALDAKGIPNAANYLRDAAMRLAALQERCERLEEAARALLAKLDLIHDHPRFMAVWSAAQDKLGPYDGPQYVEEIDALRAIVTPEHSGGYSMAPEDTDPAKMPPLTPPPDVGS